MSGRGPRWRRALGGAYDALPGKQPAFEVLRRVARLPEPVFRHLHFHGIFRVRVPGGGGFLLRHHGTQIENEIFWRGLDGGWEAGTVRLWLRLAASASTVVDVGANTGVFAIAARAVNPTARVVAIEPVEEVWRRLDGNCRLNGGGVEAIRAAASDREGGVELRVPAGEGPLSASVEAAWHAHDPGALRVQVDALRLDSILHDDSPRPVVIKVDVEGHETAVLRGLGERIGALRPTLFVEVLSDDAGDAISELLGPHGYRWFHVHERRGPTPVARIRALPGGLNYLCCGEDVARSLGLSGAVAAPSPR